jgi:hypothetical protein
MIETAIGTAETYSENQSVPARMQNTTQIAKFEHKHFRGLIGETGHARRARGSSDQNARIANPELQMQKCIQAIRYLMATTFDDAGIYGLDGIISGGTHNFGDLSRTTHAALKSYELNASTAGISTALMNKMHYASMDDPYGADPDLYVMSPTQARRWAEVVSGKVAPLSGGSAQITATGLEVGGKPVFILPNFTSSVVAGMTDVAGSWGYVPNEDGPGNFHVRVLGSADDSDSIHISTAGALVCTTPNRQSRTYGLSTG